METKEEKPNSAPPERTIDWFLQKLVEFANSKAISLGITLNVGGTLVSGTLIGGERYFEGFAKDVATGFKSLGANEESTKAIKEYFEGFKQIYQKPEDDPIAADPTFIHLENARFYYSGNNPIPGNRGMFWRGKITSVDGFILGLLQAEHK